MARYLLLSVVAVASYLIGAIPFGYLVAKWKSVDILRQGSGNIGATNVGRVLGRKYGILVFLLDFAKGAGPVLAAKLTAPLADETPLEWLEAAAGVAAFLGHLFPIYLRFRGGKGVATGAGVVAVLTPVPALAALAAWVVVVSATRYVSVASLVAALLLCVLRLTVTPAPWTGPASVITTFCLLAAAVVALRHRANIGRLVQGTENRLKENSAMMTFTKTLHVLAVGLWFGMAAFFTLQGVVMFGTFEQLTMRPAEERPVWLPTAPSYEQRRPSERFPEPLRKEQGSRIFGAAVGPLFDWYYGLQIFCSTIAAVTAFGWWSQPGKVHHARVAIVLAGVIAVWGGWLLEGKVEHLRGPRNDLSDEVLLRQADGSLRPTLLAEAEAARVAFGQWHGYSLLLNFAALGLATAAMALSAQLPTSTGGPLGRAAPGDAGATKPPVRASLVN